MILAAGRGTRMEPLSSCLPKALFPVLGKPLFGIIAEKLLREGAVHLHANLYHLGAQIEEYALGASFPVTFHREEELLDTGGGIGNMAAVLRDTGIALIHNCDVISSAGFGPAIEMHRRTGALFTMMLATGPEGTPSGRMPPPHVAVSDDGNITGFAGRGTSLGAGLKPADSGQAPGMYGYTGMAVMSMEAVDHFPVGKKAGLVDILLSMIDKRPGSVKGYIIDGGAHPFTWAETGTIPAYIDLHRRILNGRELFDPTLKPPRLPLYAGDGSVIDPRARWKGFLCVGRESSIGKNVFLEDCVVLDKVTLAPGVCGKSTVFYPGGEISGNDG